MTKAKSAAPDMRELTVVYRDPASLTDYENNSRTHSPEQIEKLRASIREFGFTNPILLKNDDTTIGAGHARNMAALAEGLDRVPTITLHGLSDAQWRAYVIADNQLALTGSGWDEDILRTEMEALAAMDFDMPVLGFDAEDLELHLGFTSSKAADDVYTKNIEPPTYTPAEVTPALGELLDATKVNELVSEITKANLPQDLTDFLTAAAMRHTVFNFDKIADYYAAASPEVQRLMEASALVIIDFHSAIEGGFVNLTDELTAQWLEESDEDSSDG